MLPIIIAQITDLHVREPGELVFERFDTSAALRRCVDAILQLPARPDVVIASGDLVNAGSPEEYRFLRELLAPLPMPLYLLPGNHDERSTLRMAFSDHTYLPEQGELFYTVAIGGLRLIMLDTVVPGEDGGALSTGQLQWLEHTLASAPACPNVIFMHHPPCATGIPYMDRIALDSGDATRLGALIARNGHVERICCGHVHRAITARWSGTTAGVCPSSAFQYIADPRPEAVPLTTLEQPAFQLHLWDGAQLTTHTLQITEAT